MKNKRYLEFINTDLDPIQSFKMKSYLHKRVWETEAKMFTEISEQLIKIANDFYDGIVLDIPIKDITLTGSLANYNWSEEYSDFDLHIIIDFKESKIDRDVLRQYVDYAKSDWNSKHEIKIVGFDVEVYIQDEDQPHTSSGVYSVLNSTWLVKPSKRFIDIDEKLIEEKAKTIMLALDDMEREFFEIEDHEVFAERLSKLTKKMSSLRKEALLSGDEFSIGNLIFKLLRRNGYIGRLLELRRKSYDRQFENTSDDILNVLYFLTKMSKSYADLSYDGAKLSLTYTNDKNVIVIEDVYDGDDEQLYKKYTIIFGEEIEVETFDNKRKNTIKFKNLEKLMAYLNREFEI